ncbi:MAG: restriction endonuclease subunit S [Clostridium sp.]|uniref:restriction endonuclease subunit S n=1 Tax=Clostridium sp. TaxID=1506 RepID=UPI0025B7B1E2|nr:restriction endonuclease subunit S [Clostridium sp.]MCE5219784.1 restriction endonuclease subunit S [Clostridium sp.]
MVREKKIPDGYKETEVGIIPSDWDIRNVDQFAEIDTGKRNTEDKEDSGKYDFFVRSKQIEKINSYSFDGEAVLTAGDGVGVGKVFHYISGKFDYHQRVYKISNFKNVNGRYFYEYFKNNFLNQVSKYTAKSSVDSVRLEMISKMKIPIPLEKEQKAIATALSDIDDLILSLEKLINKKKLIKQGAMQELLTGKKRLDGFSEKSGRRYKENKNTEGYKKTEVGIIPEDWNLMSLSSICVPNGLVRGPFGGSLKKEFFVKKGYKVYEQRNAIYKDLNIGNYYINQEKYNELIRFEVNVGEFIVSCSGTIGKIYKIPNNAPKGVINQALLKIKIDSTIVDDSYFNSYFSWYKFQNRIIDSTQGGAMKNLVGMDVFKNTLIPIPTIEEQKAIANILSDMDNEIEKLETKLDKYKNIKRGMMEELLTGKRRLV